MKHILTILVVASCLVGPVAAVGDPNEASELDRLREELSRTQQQLEQLSRQIERLSRDRPAAVIAPRSYSFGGEARPMVGIIMNAAADRRGVLLVGVTPEGPAEQAGLRSGDLIVEIDGQTLAGRSAVDEAYDLLDGMKAGDTFEFVYERDGERKTATVTAELHQPSWSFGYSFEMPDIQLGEDSRFGLDLDQFKDYADRLRDWQWNYQELPGSAYLWRFGFAWSGLELARLNPDLARYFGTTDGVLVIESDLAGGALKGGDVIVAIDGEPVSDPKQAMRRLGRFEPGAAIPLRIIRDRAEQPVTLIAPSVRSPNVGFYFDGRDENGKRPSQ